MAGKETDLPRATWLVNRGCGTCDYKYTAMYVCMDFLQNKTESNKVRGKIWQ